MAPTHRQTSIFGYLPDQIMSLGFPGWSRTMSERISGIATHPKERQRPWKYRILINQYSMSFISSKTVFYPRTTCYGRITWRSEVFANEYYSNDDIILLACAAVSIHVDSAVDMELYPLIYSVDTLQVSSPITKQLLSNQCFYAKEWIEKLFHRNFWEKHRKPFTTLWLHFRVEESYGCYHSSCVADTHSQVCSPLHIWMCWQPFSCDSFSVSSSMSSSSEKWVCRSTGCHLQFNLVHIILYGMNHSTQQHRESNCLYSQVICMFSWHTIIWRTCGLYGFDSLLQMIFLAEYGAVKFHRKSQTSVMDVDNHYYHNILTKWNVQNVLHGVFEDTNPPSFWFQEINWT